MLSKYDTLKKYPELHIGMDAYNLEGDKLGRLLIMEDDYLLVEKGFFFPRDFSFRYDDIVSTSDGTVTINQHRENLANWKDEKYKGWEEYDRMNTGEETRIPVHEEELTAKKVEKPKAEVHIRKVVHTELKQFTVPVTKEEVVIEHKPVEKGKALETGETAFKETETTIPLSEEEVEVTKKPVTKEEVTIRKEAKTEQEKVSGAVKKEEVKVDLNKEEPPRKKAA